MGNTTHVAGYYNEMMSSFNVVRVGGAGLRSLAGGRLDVMEIHYAKGAAAPKVGNLLSVWIDVSTPYAMAPRREVAR